MFNKSFMLNFIVKRRGEFLVGFEKNGDDLEIL